jgi:hypothetical protein
MINNQAKAFVTSDAESIAVVPVYKGTKGPSLSRVSAAGGSPLGFLAAYPSVWWSADSTVWEATGPTSYSLTSVGMSTVGFYGWQLGSGGQNPTKAWRSLDGITWTTAGLPSLGLNALTTIDSAGSNLVVWERTATGTGKLSISANAGLTWLARTAPPVITGKTWNASAYAGGKLFLFTTGNQYVVTSNFTTWQLKTLPYTDVFRIACASPNGSKIVLIGDRQQAAVCIDTTAETWLTEPLPILGNKLSYIAASSTKFIAFGTNECCVRDIARSGLPSL